MKKKGIALVERQYLFPFVLITSLFFLWGFAHAILDVLNKHFQELLTITRTHSAMIQATMYMGYFIMAIPAGLFINRHGYRKGVVLGLLLYGIGSLLFIPGQYIASFNMFLFSLFVIGCGLTFLETAANPYVTELGARETAASRLNFAQSFNGLGCIFAPILTGLLLFSDEDKGASGNVALPYAVMGVIVLLAALAFMRIRLPEIPHEEEVDSEGHRVGLWAHKLFVFGLVALFAYEVSEISINSFFINYVTEVGWMNARDASLVLSFGGLGLFMVGRFVGSWIMRRVRAEKMLFWCATGTVITTLLVILDLGSVSFVALLCGYAFEAIMFPTIFALSLKGLGSHTKRASSFLMMSPVGGAVGPVLMGLVGDYADMHWAFIVPFVGYVVVWFYARHMMQQKN
ncbi:sugar MFS transporter [Phocaeicola plebeius]|uniref:sugar MFS transporter n=1 Tax=Phocaeicola plebeius TaxID=310297 RepID=UPI0026F23334|nr:sugar MFS transporter [Phocaeicola plebeius]